MDDTASREPVKLCLDLAKLGLGGGGVRLGLEAFDERPQADFLVPIAEATASVLTDALGGGLVLGHEIKRAWRGRRKTAQGIESRVS